MATIFAPPAFVWSGIAATLRRDATYLGWRISGSDYLDYSLPAQTGSFPAGITATTGPGGQPAAEGSRAADSTRITVADATGASLDAGEVMSWSCWINVASKSANTGVWSHGSSSENKGWSMAVSSLDLGFYVRIRNWIQRTVAEPITLNTWHHVAVSIDADRDVFVWVNGESEALENRSGSKPATLVASTSSFRLLGQDTAGSFGGKVAEPAVWRRLLTAREIQWLSDPNNRLTGAAA